MPTHSTIQQVEDAKTAAKQEAVAAVRGADKTQVVVGQPAVPVPTVADLFKELEALKSAVPGMISTAVQATLDSVQVVMQQQATTQANALTAQAQAFTAALNGYVTTSAMNTALAGKAAASALSGLATTQALTDGLAGKASTTALTDGLALKLNKAGDTATGMIKVPTADASAGRTAAPRFEQVLGGINQPIRIGQNVGSTPVALDAVIDTTGLNRKWMPFNIAFLMTQAPPAGLLNLLGATVVLKVGTTSGGSDVYSKTVSVSGLSGLLNKLLTPETASAAFQLTSGSQLYVTVTPSSGTDPGKWSAVVVSVFIPNAS